MNHCSNVTINTITMATKAENRAAEQQAAVQQKSNELAEQYHGTRYADLVKANPYLQYNYELGLWDRIGNVFGFRTAEDQRREEMQQAAAEYNSQIASLKSEDEYNSPAAKAARMQQAGQNPDILGTEGAADAAAFNEPETTPTVPGSEEDQQLLQAISNFGGNVISVASTAIGLADQVQGMMMRGTELERNRLENSDKYLEAARKYVLEYIKPEDFETAQARAKKEKKGIITTYYDEEGKNWAQLNFKTAKGRKKFERALDIVEKSLPTSVEAYKKWHAYETERVGYNKLRASGGWSTDDEAMAKFWEAIIQPLEDLDKLKNSLEKDIQEHMNEWRDEETGLSIAEYEAAGRGEEAKTRWNDYQLQQKKIRIQSSMESTWDKILKNADGMINSKDQKEHFWGWLIKVAVMYIRTMSISTSSGIGSKGTPVRKTGMSMGGFQ